MDKEKLPDSYKTKIISDKICRLQLKNKADVEVSF